MFNEKCYELINGNMLDKIEELDENSVDSIVTDPPYELNFMKREWDNAGISFQKETWEKCLRVLKPGGYLLAFGGSRTFHRIACAIEDAGFEIRDTIMWLYGSGFPKSMNIGLAIDKKYGIESEVVGQNKDILIKQKKDLETGKRKIVDSLNAGASDRNNGFVTVSADIKVPVSDDGKKYKGWGTTLKPSFEPIIVARKPLDGSCVDNVIKWGVGGINIDECRVGSDERTYKGAGVSLQKISNHEQGDTGIGMLDGSGKDLEFTVNGRFPANTILTYDDTNYNEVCGGFPDSGTGNGDGAYLYAGREYDNKDTSMFNGDKPQAPSNYNDTGSASRYFYCAKASRKDRDEGCEYLSDTYSAVSNQAQAELQRGNSDFMDMSNRAFNKVYVGKNTHPTVKPTELMQYLIRLVTPKEGIVLDPFMGSGSTGKATMFENRERNANYKFVGIELDNNYIRIADARISYALNGFTYMSEDFVENKEIELKNKKDKPSITLW